MKVIVTGASGLLGQEIVDVFQEYHNVIPLKGRSSIDVTNTKEIVTFISNKNPDLIIHSAGWRDLDECEKNREKTLMINTFGTKNIVHAAREVNCPLVYISSDAVYDGAKKEPNTVFDKTNPLNVYGYSKLKAEEIIISLYNKYFILRVPILFGSKGWKDRNIIYDIWKKIKEGKKVFATTNQICSPTYTEDVARALLKIVETKFYGIYNFSNEGIASRYDLFKKIAELKGLSTDSIIPIKSTEKYAKRAENNTSNCIIFKNTFDYEIDDWQNALKRCISKMDT